MFRNEAIIHVQWYRAMLRNQCREIDTIWHEMSGTMRDNAGQNATKCDEINAPFLSRFGAELDDR
jgi:hypothetical protein